MRELTFKVPGDFLWSRRNEDLVGYLRSIRTQITPMWGENGKTMGLGFLVYTRSRSTNYRLSLLKRRMLKALVTTRIVSIDVVKNGIYNLEQRVFQTFDTPTGAVLTFKEE